MRLQYVSLGKVWSLGLSTTPRQPHRTLREAADLAARGLEQGQLRRVNEQLHRLIEPAPAVSLHVTLGRVPSCKTKKAWEIMTIHDSLSIFY